MEQRKGAGIAAFVRMVTRRFIEDRCMQVASSLTFTTLLAIVPTVTVALTLMSAFPAFREATDNLETFLWENMIPESAASLTTYAGQFADNAGKLTAVGLIFLFVTAMIVLMTIDRALNEIWRVPRPRPVVQRIFIYWALLTVGPLLIGVSLSLTSWLVSISLGAVRDIPHAGRIVLRIVPVLLTGLAFALLYATLPNRRVLLRDALTGGLLAALAFEAMKHAFAFYVTRFPTYKLVYGAFAAVPIFLLWIYLSWLVVLFGAMAAAVLPDWRERGAQVKAAPGRQFVDALQILRMLRQAQGTGVVVTERELHGAIKIPMHEIEAILHAMSEVQWVGRARGGWTLTRDPALLTVGDVYDLFVFRARAPLPVRQSGVELDRIVLDYADERAAGMDVSVEALFERAASRSAPAAETAPDLAATEVDRQTAAAISASRQGV